MVKKAFITVFLTELLSDINFSHCNYLYTYNKNSYLVAVFFPWAVPKAEFEPNVTYVGIQNFLFYGKKLSSYTTFHIFRVVIQLHSFKSIQCIFSVANNLVKALHNCLRKGYIIFYLINKNVPAIFI